MPESRRELFVFLAGAGSIRFLEGWMGPLWTALTVLALVVLMLSLYLRAWSVWLGSRR